MNNDYEKLKEFWNNTLKDYEPYTISSWVEDEKFIEIINKYVNINSNVLDYACGSGWGIFEIYSRVKFKFGLGLDTAKDAIKINNDTCNLNNIENISFITGDENKLKDYNNFFDFVISINLFDVIPDEVIYSILDKIYASMKDDSIFFVGLNPDFTVDELLNLLKMNQVGNYFYKDNILRCNKKTVEDWNEIFSSKFKVIEQFKFALTENEKKYPRIGFLLKK